ncbi:hypothetical protein [Anaerocolumna sp. MB42-C2]|uniref:hypothetical protein n=1 Tax=Anaerocolumna sp. MB42-C2 TaxID=3070997 RepID=UPI0027E1DB0D|nr:hypothetical protein [Anaerocolumna sp. MB42-C2]WMJ90337.1 hypothetical protein RBU59_12635 [Anaerocolumna sp. MB42-C2]
MEYKKNYHDQIFQSAPVFSDDYLNEILHLTSDNTIQSKIILEDKATDTARIIKLLISWKDSSEKFYSKKLFLKMPIIGAKANAFDKWSKHEIEFYRNVNENDELPIIKCQDAFISDDKKNFLLILDDISDDYCSANDINHNEIGYWLNAAESLAKFHSFFWNGANASKLKRLQGDDKTIDDKIKNYQNALDKFLIYASEFYNNDIFDVYPLALADTIMFESKNLNRRVQNKNISVIHGDSHIWNFMFPKSSYQRPLLTDYQFWRMGITTVDIMNLTRVSFPYRDDPEYHLKVLKYYHESLLKYGIKDYSMDECLEDYLLSVAMAVFGPVLNYYDFELGHEYWGQGVYDTINNYKTVRKLLCC